jgi:hypothetical protein
MNFRAILFSIVLAAYAVGAHAQVAVPVMASVLATNTQCSPKDMDELVNLRCSAPVDGIQYMCVYSTTLTCPTGDKVVKGTVTLTTPNNNIVRITKN